MTLSELIAALQALPAEYADYPVEYLAGRDGEDSKIDQISVEETPVPRIWLEETETPG